MQETKNPESYLRIEEIAKRLDLSKRGVEEFVKRKIIPAYKISSRCLRFRWSEVEAAINRYRQREIH